MADLNAAEITRERAVTGKTHDHEHRSWDRWCTYLESIGIHNDQFLDEFSQPQRTLLVGAFAVALREGRFSGSAYDSLATGTITNTISSVAQTFRENGRRNPSLDDDRKLSVLLSRLYRAFRNTDKPLKQQKALPVIVLKELANLLETETQRAISQLSIGAFFFAMRSCEYTKVPQAEKGRTDVIRLRCIRFFKDGRIVPHDNLDLFYSDCVSITFEMQKKDEKMDTVTQIATTDRTLCPVRQWAAIVQRIWGYEGATADTKVSAVWVNGRIEHITSRQIVDALEAATEAVGYERLNLKKGDIGTHSIRSGAAMAMYLGEVPVYSIMMIGRWSSDAFLRYIRKQVEQFSHNVSKRMITFQYFRHIPEQDPRISHHDPRQRNHPSNAETRRNVGGDTTRRARLPAFSLFN